MAMSMATLTTATITTTGTTMATTAVAVILRLKKLFWKQEKENNFEVFNQ